MEQRKRNRAEIGKIFLVTYVRVLPRSGFHMDNNCYARYKKDRFPVPRLAIELNVLAFAVDLTQISAQTGAAGVLEHEGKSFDWSFVTSKILLFSISLGFIEHIPHYETQSSCTEANSATEKPSVLAWLAIAIRCDQSWDEYSLSVALELN